MPLDEQILHVHVAMANLAHGRALNEIAEEIGRSRFVTARMDRRARDLGLVEVRPTVAEPIDVELSTLLARRFGLRSALGRAAGGATFPLHVPILIDPEAAPILRHPALTETMRRFRHVRTAFLTIGGWPHSSLLARILAENGERSGFEKRGVVAEIGTTLLDVRERTLADLRGALRARPHRQREEGPRRVPHRGRDALAQRRQ